jgi:hypothetical protein
MMIPVVVVSLVFAFTVNPSKEMVQRMIVSIGGLVSLSPLALFVSALYLKKQKTLITAQDDAARQAPAPRGVDGAVRGHCFGRQRQYQRCESRPAWLYSRAEIARTLPWPRPLLPRLHKLMRGQASTFTGHGRMTTKAKAILYAIIILACAGILLALDSNRLREGQERIKSRTAPVLSRPIRGLRPTGY